MKKIAKYAPFITTILLIASLAMGGVALAHGYGQPQKYGALPTPTPVVLQGGTANLSSTNVTGTFIVNGTTVSNLIILEAKKTSTTGVTSNTSLTNDAQLFIPLSAHTYYVISGMLGVQANAAGGFQMTFTIPTGATIQWQVYSNMVPGTSFADTVNGSGTTANATAVGKTAAFTGGAVRIVGYVYTNSTAGNLQLAWSQNASSPNTTNVTQGSWLMAQPLP